MGANAIELRSMSSCACTHLRSMPTCAWTHGRPDVRVRCAPSHASDLSTQSRGTRSFLAACTPWLIVRGPLCLCSDDVQA